MTAIEQQDIVLYSPTMSPFPLAFTLLCLPLVAFLPRFFQWDISEGLTDLLFILCAVWLGPIMLWRQIHHPHPNLLLAIHAEGIESHLSRHVHLFRWEEIAAIYRTKVQNQWGFAVDLTPAGLLALSPRQRKRLAHGKDPTRPQQALVIPTTRLPIPAGELLARIHEQFSEQLARYHIDFQA